VGARLLGAAVLGLAVVAVSTASAQDAGDTHAEAGIAYYGNDDKLGVTSPWAAFDVNLSPELNVGVGWTADAISSATIDVITSATPAFRETRHETSVNLAGDLRTVRVGGGWIGSFESDTHSNTFFGSGEVDLFKRNLTLALGYGFAWYRVGQVGEPVSIWQDRFVHQIDATGTLVLSRSTLVSATYTLMLMRGYLANPYLDVPLFSSDPALQVRSRAQWVESRHPEARDRHALSAQVRQALGGRVFLKVLWRGYLDDWAMRSHSIELAVSLDLGKGVVLEISDRFHWQSSVSFYRSLYTVNRDFITRDRRLGKMMTDIARVALRPRMLLGGKRGKMELVFSAELQWTRYDDYKVLDGEDLRQAPDSLAGVGQVGISWDR